MHPAFHEQDNKTNIYPLDTGVQQTTATKALQYHDFESIAGSKKASTLTASLSSDTDVSKHENHEQTEA